MGKGVRGTPTNSRIEDHEWVTAALAGDQSAFARLAKKYTPGLRHHVLRIVRSPKEVNDLVQEILIKAFAALSTYKSSWAFSTWLYRIATNHVIDHLRRRRLSTISIDRTVDAGDGAVPVELPDTTYRPDRHIVADQRRTLIQEAIDALPPKYNRVIVLRHQKELSYEQIAQTLSLPLGTVKAHIFRARKLLYRLLQDRRDSI